MSPFFCCCLSRDCEVAIRSLTLSFLSESISSKFAHSLTSLEWVVKKKQKRGRKMYLIRQRQLQLFSRSSNGRLWLMSTVWISCFLTCGGETEQARVCVFVWEGKWEVKKQGDSYDTPKQCWQKRKKKKVCIIYSTETAGTEFDTEGNM